MRIIYHDRYLDHYHDRWHPESPKRLEAIVSELQHHGLFKDIVYPEAEKLSSSKIMEILKLSHDPGYIEYVNAFPEGYLDPDTYKRDETFEIAGLAAYGGLIGAEYSYKNNAHSICLLRPPGHHAGYDYCGGFCYFNNIAIAAEYLLKHLGASKVAIVDIDVHHGNGTWDIFRERKDVLYISTHQWGIYPGTGSISTIGDGPGTGYTVSIPFLSGTGDSSYKLAYRRIISPILMEYQPDVILVSIGVDAHYRDPLASLTLSSTGYIDLVMNIINIADKVSNGRVSLFLEGGYDLEALSEVIAGIIAKDRGEGFDAIYTEVHDEDEIGGEVVDNITEILSKYWSLK